MYKTVTPDEAKGLLDKGYTYIDVRTVDEFKAGHPAGAVNIPVLNPGMVPNDDFLNVVEVNFPRDARLILGCKSGGRSARAAGMLAAAGYGDVVNMDGGFEGRYDATGRLVQPGWSQEDLPTSAESAEGATYEELARRAREE